MRPSLYLLIILLFFPFCMSAQVVTKFTLKDSTTRDIFVVPPGYTIPGTWKEVGKEKSGEASGRKHQDFYSQLNLILRAAYEDSANVIQITRVTGNHTSYAFHGEAYYAPKIEALKKSVADEQKARAGEGASYVTIYQGKSTPNYQAVNFKLIVPGNDTIELKGDTKYTFRLKGDTAYKLRFANTPYEEVIKLQPGKHYYVRLYYSPKEVAHPGIMPTGGIGIFVPIISFGKKKHVVPLPNVDTEVTDDIVKGEIETGVISTIAEKQ